MNIPNLPFLIKCRPVSNWPVHQFTQYTKKKIQNKFTEKTNICPHFLSLPIVSNWNLNWINTRLSFQFLKVMKWNPIVLFVYVVTARYPKIQQLIPFFPLFFCCVFALDFRFNFFFPVFCVMNEFGGEKQISNTLSIVAVFLCSPNISRQKLSVQRAKLNELKKKQ